MQVRAETPGFRPFFVASGRDSDLNFFIGIDAIAPTGDDGTSNIPIAGAFTFDFHGVQYPDVWVRGNGYANFGALSTVNSAGFVADYVSFVGAEPGIAVHQTDWSPIAGVHYVQIANQAVVTWGDPAIGGNMGHFGSSDNGSIFSLTLEMNDGANPANGAFTITQDSLVDNPALTFNHYGTGAFGHTPGGAFGVASTDLNQVNVSAAGGVQLEEHALQGEGATPPTLNGWDAAGSARNYNNSITNKNGRSINSYSTRVKPDPRSSSTRTAPSADPSQLRSWASTTMVVANSTLRLR